MTGTAVHQVAWVLVSAASSRTLGRVHTLSLAVPEESLFAGTSDVAFLHTVYQWLGLNRTLFLEARVVTLVGLLVGSAGLRANRWALGLLDTHSLVVSDESVHAGASDLAGHQAVHLWSILLWALLLGAWVVALVGYLVDWACEVGGWWWNWNRLIRRNIAVLLLNTTIIRSSAEESTVTLTSHDALQCAKSRSRKPASRLASRATRLEALVFFAFLVSCR